MKWLLNNRTDFDDNGWAQLLPKEKFEYAVMGGNHFTMMKGEHVSSPNQCPRIQLTSYTRPPLLEVSCRRD